MKTLTITQLKQERPEVRTIPHAHGLSIAWIDGCWREGKSGPTERDALQSLCRAMNWDVEVVEDTACPHGFVRWDCPTCIAVDTPTIRTVTVSELLKEHPGIHIVDLFQRVVAFLPGCDPKKYPEGPNEVEALQSLADAESWNVKVVEDRKEQCKLCQQWVTDWVDPDWAGGRICRPCESKHDPDKSYCTRCGKLPDGCVCEDGVRLDGGPFDQTTVTDKTIPIESHPTPTPRVDAEVEKIDRESLTPRCARRRLERIARTLEQELTAALKTIKELRK